MSLPYYTRYISSSMLQENLENLAELRERQLRWRHRAMQLQNEIASFRSDVAKEVRKPMKWTPLTSPIIA